MAVVTLKMTDQSYGDDYAEPLYKNDGTESLEGIDFGDIETGREYAPRYMWLRHDGLEPVYNVAYYIRTVGVEWGGYVADREDAHDPYNPNWFRSGGLNDDSGLPNTSTTDYEILRTSAKNNAEMGLRIHYDRADEVVRTDGLGYENKGLNFSSIGMASTACDYSGTDASEINGYIYPEPVDENKFGVVGDEGRLGLSLKMPEDLVGSGHIQFGFAVKYRYTT